MYSFRLSVLPYKLEAKFDSAVNQKFLISAKMRLYQSYQSHCSKPANVTFYFQIFKREKLLVAEMPELILQNCNVRAPSLQFSFV